VSRPVKGPLSKRACPASRLCLEWVAFMNPERYANPVKKDSARHKNPRTPLAAGAHRPWRWRSAQGVAHPQPACARRGVSRVEHGPNFVQGPPSAPKSPLTRPGEEPMP